jgi:transcriptional regulator with XRE-family HTH domain
VDTFLRDRRTLRTLSATDVAGLLDVHPNSVLRWERRERLPGPDHLRKLARTLAADVSDVASFFDLARAPSPPAGGVRGPGLRPLRRTACVSVRRIADALGVRDSTVYNWEAGRVRVPDEHLAALAALFRMAVPDLVQQLRDAPPRPQPTPLPPLRRMRRRTGLSQEAVAQRIGTSRHRLGAWERGQRPPLWAVRRLAPVYGIPVARLADLVGVAAPALRTLRAWAGLTQAEVGARCGFHPTSVRAWENARTVPSARSRERLERLYGLSPGALVVAYPSAD